MTTISLEMMYWHGSVKFERTKHLISSIAEIIFISVEIHSIGIVFHSIYFAIFTTKFTQRDHLLIEHCFDGTFVTNRLEKEIERWTRVSSSSNDLLYDNRHKRHKMRLTCQIHRHREHIELIHFLSHVSSYSPDDRSVS